MKLQVLLVATAATLFAGSALADQIVLDFEDLGGGLAPMPEPYGGIAEWGSFAYSDNFDENYPAYSGDTYTLSVGPPESIKFGTDYIFDGAYFAGNDLVWWVRFELYNDGDLVHTSEEIYPQLTHQWLASGYDGPVDEVFVASEFANFWCMDDFTYSTIEAGPALGITASCPEGGPAVVEWSGCTPGGQIALLYAADKGSFVVPNGRPCAGITIDLGKPFNIAYRGGAGADGSRVMNVTAGPGVCGGYVQLVDLGSCETSNLVIIE